MENNFNYQQDEKSFSPNKGFGTNEVMEKPNNYLALSIVSAVLGLCSCIGLITGIIAIVMSTQSTSHFKKGDYTKAVSYAKYAKILAIVSLVIFVLAMIRSYYNIQEMGGWDGFMEQIQEAMEAAEQ